MAKPKTKALTEKAIYRRIKFLLNEARSKHPVRDQTVTFAMRFISNFVVVRKDASSHFIKKHSKWMSRKAAALRYEHAPGNDWIPLAVNEHQETLEQVWQWIRDNRKLGRKQILDRFKQWPMVTVTKAEDKCLRRFRKCGPEERYQKANIEVGTFENGQWKARSEV